jgi:putative transposase
MPKHLRRLESVWLEQQLYLVNTGTYQRSPVLATDSMAGEVIAALEEASQAAAWRVGRYVVMPDHVHFFCTPTPDAHRMSDFIGRWKSLATRRVWRLGHSGRLWQREFFDHLLRSDESYAAQWEYVRQNPVRAGLCETPDDWPYQGEMVALGR